MLYLTPWTSQRTNGHPLDLFGRFSETLDRLFHADAPAAPANGCRWESSLRETEKEVLATFDAPGFETSEFDIQVKDEDVVVSAEHRIKEGEQEYVERTFQRAFTLPCAVELEKVEAKYRNGVLEVRFPKAEPPRSRKIEVVGA